MGSARISRGRKCKLVDIILLRSNIFQLKESFKLKGGININDLQIFKTTVNAGLRHEQKDTKTLSHEESSTNRFFEENTGEIHTGKAVCYADDLRIVRNVRPKFSTEFLEGILTGINTEGA